MTIHARDDPTTVDEPRKLRAGCKGLVGLMVVGTAILVLSWILSVFVGPADVSRRAVAEDATPTLASFFAATTRGDVAAATSLLEEGSRVDVAARLAKDPERYRIAKLEDVVPIDVPLHNEFILGARLFLSNGFIKHARFSVTFNHAMTPEVDELDRRWKRHELEMVDYLRARRKLTCRINDFEIGDKPPSRPTLYGQ